MRCGVCLHRRRADVLRRQGLQERAQAVQELQIETRSGRELGLGELSTLGNENDLFAVREGNHGALQAHAGSAGLLPRMIPTAAVNGCSGLVGDAGPFWRISKWRRHERLAYAA